MYLWNVDALVKDFQNNNVNSAEEFKYFFTSTLYIAFISNLSLISINSSTDEGYESLFSLITLVINAIGCYANYRLNQHGDDKDFVKRCVCLGIPIAIKINTIVIITLILLVLIFSDSPGEILNIDSSSFNHLFSSLDEPSDMSEDSTDESEETPTTMISALIYILAIWPSNLVYYYLLARKLEKIAYYTPPVFETTK